ncbi:MAG TPA: uroporphyrinogen-III C-methyltransferase [Telluria sp.]|nr:uroporphyrinogen-III C-methyltransferase [Telluria sp.]
MNDLPTLPDQNPTAAPVSAPTETRLPEPAQPVVNTPESVRVLTVAVVVLGLLLAALAWSSHNRIQSLREDMARSLQKDEQLNKDTSATAKQVMEQNRELAVKVGVLESRQAEAQSQQLALEQLYQDLSKNRDEWALSEIEQVLDTASQQLQLSGNVQGALIALQNADRSLSRSDKPQFISIRRAIAKDMDRLKALPQLDMAGVAVRIDNVISQLDNLPMLAAEKPAAPAVPEKPARPQRKGAKPAPATLPDTSLAAKLQDTWNAWSTEMWADVRDLIRVRKVDTPEALMLSPSEQYFVRENLKLRLLNARVALLSRNESAFRGDLAAAQESLAKYFDTRAKPTQTAQALLRQVAANNLAIEMPSLSESLNAVRNYKAK